MRAVPLIWVVLVGCAGIQRIPQHAPPALLALDQVVPPQPTPARVPATVTLYPDRPVLSGQCPGLPAGILVSPAAYAETILVLSDHQRLRREATALRQLVQDERAAWAEYQRATERRVQQLEAQAARRRWYLWGGVAAGTAAALAAGWALR